MAPKNDGKMVVLMIIALIAFCIGAGMIIRLSLIVTVQDFLIYLFSHSVSKKLFRPMPDGDQIPRDGHSNPRSYKQAASYLTDCV